jgi:hypothetical protein
MSDSLATQLSCVPSIQKKETSLGSLRLSCDPSSGFEYLLPLTFRFGGGGTADVATGRKQSELNGIVFVVSRSKL